MPYKDPEKKKEYYHRHAKGYNDKWRKESGWWNNYQREYKRKKKKDQANRIKKDAIEFNIAEEGSKTTIAWCVLVYMIETGIKKEWAIARALEYDYLNEVKPIFINWRKNKIWNGKQLNMDITNDDEHNWFEILLCAMCGAGEIFRST